ncbi:MAG TPA: radical SAM family heme chaperone HemW [Pseudomonadales bacterium]|nr:radical SAM family heme chaperone HemW [Pseudomonadales bacterium]
MNTLPLSLYIHTPWCIKKCPYCDFNSHTLQAELPEAAFLEALLEDLTNDLAYVQGRTLQSIFIGGGTPSLLSAGFYRRLLKEIAARIVFSPDIEITLEANPGTFEQAKFAGFREAGINRLSVGVQSFSASHLQALGRIHNEHEASHALRQARAVGFDNINIDLMFALPQQSIEQALHDLAVAKALEPEHISWYQLTLEPNTYFFKHPPLLPDDDYAWEMQQQGQVFLAKATYANYEISAYAREGYRARHNLNYWTFGDYLGIGPGAHGKISLPEPFRVKRYWKTRLPQDYLNPDKAYLADQRFVSNQDLAFEYMLNALRLVEGASWPAFSERTHLNRADIAPIVDELLQQGLLQEKGLAFQPTARGHQYLNFMLEKFLPD